MHIRRKLQSDHTCPGKGTGSEKTQEDRKFIPQVNTWHRDSLQQSKKTRTIISKNNNKKPSKPGEKGKSDFQRYHIIRFKRPVFNKKNHKAYKETKKYGPFKGKKKSTKTVPEKDLMADLLDKDFKTVILQMLKELKEDKEVKKTMCGMIEKMAEE